MRERKIVLRTMLNFALLSWSPFAISLAHATPVSCGSPGGSLNFRAEAVINSGFHYRQLQSVAIDGAGDAHPLSLNLDSNPKTDLIAIDAAAPGNQVVVHLNPSLTSPGATQSLTLGANPLVAIKAADLDNDGRTDIIAVSSTQLIIAWNSGDAAFNSVQIIPASATFSILGLSIGDYNSDGKLDISVSTDTLGIGSRKNLGNRGFESVWRTYLPLFSVPGAQMLSLFANSDTRIDAVRSLSPDGFFNDSGLEVFRSTSAQGGTISFASGANDHYSNLIEPARLAAGDLNNDGKDDLIIVPAGATSFSVLRNTGTSFAAPVVTAGGTVSTSHSIAVGDLNRDGSKDIILSNAQSNNISVLANSGSGVFGAASLLAVGAAPSDVAIIDIDQDGDQDVVSAHDSSGPAGLTILENTLCKRGELLLATGVRK